MAEPTRPVCPATKTRFSLCIMCPSGHNSVSPTHQSLFLARQFHIMVHHHPDYLLERHGWFPAEFDLGFTCIAEEMIHFGGSEVPRIQFHALFPVQSTVIGGHVEKF